MRDNLDLTEILKVMGLCNNIQYDSASIGNLFESIREKGTLLKTHALDLYPRLQKFIITLEKVLDIEEGSCCHCLDDGKIKVVNFEDIRNRVSKICLCKECFEEEFEGIAWLQYFSDELIKKHKGKWQKFNNNTPKLVEPEIV